MVQPLRLSEPRAAAAVALVSGLFMLVTAAQAQSPALSAPSPNNTSSPGAVPASPRTAKLDPLDPLAPVPVLRHESRLKPSLSAAEETRVSWREANDTVTRIGGWRVYLREAQLPEAPAGSTTPAAAPAPSAPAAAAPQPAAAPNAKPAAPPAGHGSRHGHQHP